MKKSITHVLAGREKKITEDETVIQPLPHKDFRFANPFIVIHHIGPEMIRPGSELRIHPHPHRGFSPVTFTIQGEGFHKDNAGHSGTIAAGGVQWMFAGKGLLHSEGPTNHMLEKGGMQEFIQIWVNVPKAHKWDAPSYQNAPRETLPAVLEQDGVQLRLASGTFDGQTGPMQSFTPIISVFGTIDAPATVRLTAQPGYHTLIYVFRGSLLVNEERSVSMHHLIVFDAAGDEITLTAESDAGILFLSGEPIQEPVAAKDNFVMNTAEEIEQAMQDYKNGVFGTLDY